MSHFNKKIVHCGFKLTDLLRSHYFYSQQTLYSLLNFIILLNREQRLIIEQDGGKVSKLIPAFWWLQLLDLVKPIQNCHAEFKLFDIGIIDILYWLIPAFKRNADLCVLCKT